jgi:hypothetical protein
MTRFVSPQKGRQSSLGSNFTAEVRIASNLAARRVFALAGVHFPFHAQFSFAESEVDENYQYKTNRNDRRY